MKVFHMCQGGGSKHSFLCPNTTIFNQRLLVCDWHMKVTCENSESFYIVNNNLYQTEEKHPQKLRTNSWIAPSHPNTIAPKFPHPNTASYKQNNRHATQAYAIEDVEVTKMPQFVVDHFKENIPRAEYGTPKSVTKSYRAIIVKPKPTISSSMKNSRNGHYINADEEPIHPQHQHISQANEELTPNKYVEEQNMKNSWNPNEMEKTLHEELQNMPEVTKSYPRGQEVYSNPGQDKLLVNDENAYYEPNFQDMNRYAPKDDEEIHFAGRQNEKVVVVSKNQQQIDVDLLGQNLPQHEQTTLFAPLLKITQPVSTTIATQPPHYRTYPTKKILIHPADNYHVHTSPRPQAKYERNEDSEYNNAPTYSNNFYNAITEIPKQENVQIRQPQYIYPLPGIVRNIDGATEYCYGYRGEDPKNSHLHRVQIFKSTSPKPSKIFKKQETGIPRSNDKIWIKPVNGVARSNNNILIKPELGTSRSINPETVIPQSNKKSQTEPRTQISVKNKNLVIIPVSRSSVHNQDIAARTQNDAPNFNKLIHGSRNSKNIGKPDTEDDPYAEKIKLRISEIKSGVESISSQVGKILGNDDHTFKNVRVFKLKPDAFNGELEEIKLTPFKFARQPSSSSSSKLKENNREELSIDVISDSDSLESSNIETTPSTFTLMPINNRKMYDDQPHSKTRTHENADTIYRRTQSAPNSIQQVTMDTSEDSLDISTPLPNNINYESRAHGYDETPKVVPHGTENENHNIKREFNPLGSHKSVSINEHRKPLDDTLDYGGEIETHSNPNLKDFSDKKYKIKYIPLITIDEASKMRTEDKNVPREPHTREDVVYRNEKSKHFDHVYVQKVKQRDTSDFIYPDVIRIEDKSLGPNNFGNFAHHGSDIKQDLKNDFYNIQDSKFSNNNGPAKNFQQKSSSNAQLTNNGEIVNSPNRHSAKNDVRTFVLITKPFAKDITTTKPNNPHQNNNHKPILIPIQAKSRPVNEGSGRSRECDESSTPQRDPATALQLGKNGPSKELIPVKSQDSEDMFYNSHEESRSKCQDDSDSRTNSHDSNSSPESDEAKQKEWNEQNTFYAKPTPKIVFKVLKEQKSGNTAGKLPAIYDRKAIQSGETKQDKMKPIKLFQLHQRNSRPAYVKPSNPTSTTSNPAHYSLTPGTNIPRTVNSYEDSPNSKSVERSKRVVNSRTTRYGASPKVASRKINPQGYVSKKRPDSNQFPAARETPYSKVAEKTKDESSDSSISQSSRSRYADIEKAAELKAERMIRLQKQKAQQ